MNNLIIIGILFVVSLIFGCIKYFGNVHCRYNYKDDETKPLENAPWQWKFIEVWNCFVNFFLAGLIGYYFILIRWEYLSAGEALNTGDFVLLIIFAMCLFGHFPHLIKNITEGINAILKRVLER